MTINITVNGISRSIVVPEKLWEHIELYDDNGVYEFACNIKVIRKDNRIVNWRIER